MTLTLLVASGVALAVTKIGSAGAQSSVVGPGESIQKAINAADPGDTIVVRGVHREDVVISKDGIKLRGDDAVIEAPTRAKADSPCSRAFGPEGVCVIGDVNLDTLTVKERVKDVSVSGFTFQGFEDKEGGLFAIDVPGARDATIVGNRVIGNVAGGIIVGVSSINTTVAKNDVIGNPKTNAGGIVVTDGSRNTTVAKNDVNSIPEGENAIEVNSGSVNTTIAGNDLMSDWVGAFVVDSPGTKILSNDVRRSGNVGIFLAGQKSENAKVVGNDISGGPWGIYATDAHGGSVLGNEVHDNCAGMFFEDIFSQPVGGFGVKGNTVENNTRSCRGAKFERAFSGIGIALLGAREMEVTGNHLSGNVPSGPTAVSGGVVVAVSPYFGGTAKPKNNSVIGNHFGRNKPDIFWDDSGSGNRFLGNLCDTSVPSRLCN
jgi:nitrous oxidase accessory protein NosD